jgi:alpha-L-fucosidase
VLGDNASSGAANLFDGKPETFWAAAEGDRSPEVRIDLGHHVSFDVIGIREAIRFGQRVDRVAVDRWNAGTWEPVATAAGIGARRLIRLEKPFTAARLRLRVVEAAASPVLSEFALFAQPEGAR